ncbi:MAG: CvpA family protein [Janthinobacterium lividum]
MPGRNADIQRMNALDIGLIVLIIAIGCVGLVRGFGRTMLDTLALYAGLWGASLTAPVLAARLSLHAGGAAVNESWAFCLLFLVFGALLLGVSWYVYGMTQFDAGMFDKLLGLACGLAAGTIVAHSVVAAMVTADPKCVASAAMVSTGTVSHELYSFTSYHAVMDTITGVKTYMRNGTDVAGK